MVELPRKRGSSILCKIMSYNSRSMSIDDKIKITDFTIPERLNSKIRPQDDFFGYVNSKWLSANPIPPTEGRWSTSNVLHEKSLYQLQAICEDLIRSNNIKQGSIEQQIRDFYLSGIDYNKYRVKNLASLQAIFEKIDNTTRESLSELLGFLHRIGINEPWSASLDADDKNSKTHILRLSQSGLTLPDRDYYLEKTPKMRSVRVKYREFVEKSYRLVPGLANSANQLWDSIWEFELDLAKKSRTSTKLRDVEKNYNKISYQTLKASYPAIKWDDYARELGWTPDDKLTVDQPEFLAFINDRFLKMPLGSWKTYLKWQVFVALSERISENLAQHKFEFFSKQLAGIETIPPLWKRVLGALNASLGLAVGKIYADRHFPPESKKQLQDMVEDIRDTYAERIMNLDWMEENTKKYALKKLSNIKVLIGYPEKWRSYSKLKITPNSFLDNSVASAVFENDHDMKLLHKPVSRQEWHMNPQTVNAYHDVNRLVICFPAAILQAPFFDAKAPYAINLGGIGTVIGHELTHGFDDQGCHFDAEGNMRDWQTKADKKAFDKRAKVIIDQANKFEVLPGLCLRGGLIIGESIADHGGIEIAIDCLKKKTNGAKNRLGLTDRELFFIGFASFECGDTKEELKRQYTLSDPHPDERFRVNGMVAHSDDFHDLYKTKDGDKLYRAPADRAKIW